MSRVAAFATTTAAIYASRLDFRNDAATKKGLPTPFGCFYLHEQQINRQPFTFFKEQNYVNKFLPLSSTQKLTALTDTGDVEPTQPPADQNPLLEVARGYRSGLVDYSKIRPEHVTPALDALLPAAHAAVDALLDESTPADWHHLDELPESAREPLGRVWTITRFLSDFIGTAEWYAAVKDNQSRMSDYSSRCNKNPVLNKKWEAIAASEEYKNLTPEQRTSIDKKLLAYQLTGGDLFADKKQRLDELNKEVAQLSEEFFQNVQAATDAYSYHIDEKDAEKKLAGLPDNVREEARQAAKQAGKDGYLLTLKPTFLNNVMRDAQDRDLRKTLWLANNTRASDQGPLYGQGKPEWDNSRIMKQILKLRAEKAKLLGNYPNYASLALVNRVFPSVDAMTQLLDDIADALRPAAQREWDQLREFAQSELGLDTLEPWDSMYASKRLQKKICTLDPEKVKQYFPKDVVLDGLFGIINELFGVTIHRDHEAPPAWHPDVEVFRVESAQGELLGHFYLDLYERVGKRSGAAVYPLCNRHRYSDGELKTPTAYIICNFSPPLPGKPVCLTHFQVRTLFHELAGHAMHHLLTKVDVGALSGMNVEMDAVEIPSNFMENFCREPEVLQRITKHIHTQEPLPLEMCEKLQDWLDFQRARGMIGQVRLALLDLRSHTTDDSEGEQSVNDLNRSIQKSFPGPEMPDCWRGAHTFSHIFKGGYAAGYYTYILDQALAAELYGQFQKMGSVINREMGEHYRRNILEVGGSRPMKKSLKAFLGRESDPAAALAASFKKA